MKNFPDKVFFIITGNKDKIFLKPEDDLEGIEYARQFMCPDRSNPAADLLRIIKDMPNGTELMVTFKRY